MSNNREKTESMALETKRYVCAVFFCEEKIYLVKSEDSSDLNKWQFPSVEIKPGEIVISSLLNYIKNQCGLDVNSNNINYICNIKHKYEENYLDMDAFLINIIPEERNNSCLLKDNWVNVKDIFSIPLASADVTLAQVILEY